MQNILQNLVFLNLSVSLWTARKKLRPEDLRLADGSQLPPDKLASLGSKRVMNPNALAPFATHKQRAVRAILAVGTRFLGGYVVPESRLDDLMEILDEVKTEFNAAKALLMTEYDTEVTAWIADNPGWEDVIRRSIEDASYVERQISFSVQTLHIKPVEGHHVGLQVEIDGLASQLRHEIQQAARSAWDSSYKGNVEVGQKAIRPIRSIVEKIVGLVFLEPELNELVVGIRAVLAGLPKTGLIKGADFAALCGVLHLLGDIPEAHNLSMEVPELLADDETEIEDEEQGEYLVQRPHPHVPAPALKPVADIPVQWF